MMKMFSFRPGPCGLGSRKAKRCRTETVFPKPRWNHIMFFRSTIFTGCCVLLILGRTTLAESVAIRISPNDCLVGEVVRVEITGLTPGSSATVCARMKDRQDRTWVATGVFTADSTGRIDLAQQAPTEGTYRGVDPMGLIWSVKLENPPNDNKPPAFTHDIEKPLVAAFEVESEGKTVASKELRRSFRSPGVTVAEVEEDGLVGKFYRPPGDGPLAALLVLSGSDGGINRSDGQLLASRGFAAFSLAYFKEKGLPDNLVNIPLEHLKKGLDWLASRPRVDKNRIGVVGGSRGGELALLLGATYPEFRAVVAYVPSHCVWQGLNLSGPPPDASSRTLKGEPLPYAKCRTGPAFFAQFGTGKPMELVSLFEGGLDDADTVEKAAIAVEKIRGPVMLVSGKADAMWPSSKMADLVVERLTKHNHPHSFIHLAYDGAGHAIRKSYLPAAGTIARDTLAFGGNEEANVKAQADSWPKVLQFLRESLK